MRFGSAQADRAWLKQFPTLLLDIPQPESRDQRSHNCRQNERDEECFRYQSHVKGDGSEHDSGTSSRIEGYCKVEAWQSLLLDPPANRQGASTFERGGEE